MNARQNIADNPEPHAGRFPFIRVLVDGGARHDAAAWAYVVIGYDCYCGFGSVLSYGARYYRGAYDAFVKETEAVHAATKVVQPC